MDKKKFAFTLVEILMVLIITGFIAITATRAIAIQKRAYTTLSYYALKNVKAIITEIMADSAVIGEDYEISKVESVTIADNMYENVISNTTNLYKRVPDLLNTTHTGDIFNNFNDDGELELSGAQLNNPTITTTNGQRYYMSSIQEPDASAGEYPYLYIAVDLNGTAGPNCSGAIPNCHVPDVISFRVYQDGEIFPIGVAADGITEGGKTYRYLTSKLKGYRFSNPGTDDGDIPIECKKNLNGEFLNNRADYNCNYTVNNVPKQNTGEFIYTYREAYCSTITDRKDITSAEGTITILNTRFPGYCDGVANIINTSCPPSNAAVQFDKCEQEIMKPLFRFNFK